MALDHLKHLLGNIFRLVPMGVVPLLKLFHLAAELHIEFHVSSKPRKGEVTGAYQGRRTDHRQFAMGYVGLGVKFLLVIDTALDLAATDSFDDLVNASQKIIFFLFTFNAVIQHAFDAGNAIVQRTLGALGNLVAHQNADLVQLLPLTVKG